MTHSNVPTADKPQTTNTMDANTIIRFWGHDVDWWNGAMLVALSFAALAAVAVVGATTGVIVSQKQQSAADQEALEKYKADSGVRTAILEKEAADARSETERIKQVVAWRTITPVDALKLETALAEKPGAVNLRYMDGDPEALFLAIQISQILDKAHWRIAPGVVKPSNAIVFGIDLPDASGVDAQTLRRAFLAAKVPFSPNELPPDGISFSISTIDGAPTLMVGSRAPALP
jgi:hypothetical protein